VIGRRHFGALAGALLLTCASAAYQGHAARQVVEGEGFCPTPDPCAVPALGAGFPLPYLLDRPTVSVPGAVHLVEDDFRPAAFLVDLLLYGVIVGAATLRWRARSPARFPALK
jgi:hypothetical protein